MSSFVLERAFVTQNFPQSWAVITLNLAVHVIMCKQPVLGCREFALTRKYRLLLLCYCWGSQILGQLPFLIRPYLHSHFVTQWKKYLTTMQITQFIIDLVIVYFGSKFHVRRQLFILLNVYP
jgi:hypothetical protein